MKLSTTLIGILAVISTEGVAQEQDTSKTEKIVIKKEDIKPIYHFESSNKKKRIEIGPAGEPIKRRYICATCGMG